MPTTKIVILKLDQRQRAEHVCLNTTTNFQCIICPLLNPIWLRLKSQHSRQYKRQYLLCDRDTQNHLENRNIIAFSVNYTKCLRLTPFDDVDSWTSLAGTKSMITERKSNIVPERDCFQVALCHWAFPEYVMVYKKIFLHYWVDQHTNFFWKHEETSPHFETDKREKMVILCFFWQVLI